MKLKKLKKYSAPKLQLFLQNKGKHVYYAEFTDELLLHKSKFSRDLQLTMSLGDKEIELGRISYVGEL